MAKYKYWDGEAWQVIGTDASKVDIADISNKLVATNLEDALLEIANKINNKAQVRSTQPTNQSVGDIWYQIV